MGKNEKELKVAWIVDDDVIYRSFIQGHLKTLGYSVIQFDNGESCLSQLRTNPDLIVLDHNLGEGMNGLETLRQIKSVNAQVPVVYLSGQNDLSSAVEALKEGVFDYIEKNSSTVVRLQAVIRKLTEIDALLKNRYHSQIRILVLTAVACFVVILSLIYFFMKES